MDPKDICQTIQQEKVTAVVWVPTLAKRLIDFEGLKDYDLSSLKKMHCGGGVSQPEIIKGVWEKLGPTFFNGYGGTEGQTTITRSDDNPQTILHTVGRPTCPYDTYKVVDRNGKELPLNSPGELIIKGPGSLQATLRHPKRIKWHLIKRAFLELGTLSKSMKQETLRSQVG
jgi:non-ribosomal peptide synthetase component E (peptide arylation enzyme)